MIILLEAHCGGTAVFCSLWTEAKDKENQKLPLLE